MKIEIRANRTAAGCGRLSFVSAFHADSAVPITIRIPVLRSSQPRESTQSKIFRFFFPFTVIGTLQSCTNTLTIIAAFDFFLSV